MDCHAKSFRNTNKTSPNNLLNLLMTMNFKSFKNKMFSPLVWGNFLAMGIITAGIIWGVMVFLDSYTKHGQSIEMPDLRGQRYEAVMMQLEALNLHGFVTDTGYITTMPANVIIEQSIAPGKPIKEGRFISFTINGNGARPLQIPDLANNSSMREAVARLKSMGFTTTEHEYIEGDAEWVYALKARGKELSVGERLPVDVPITLVVGRGEEMFADSLDTMIDFEDTTTTTEPEDEVDKLLQELGL